MKTRIERDLLAQARAALEQNQPDTAQGLLVNLVVEQPRNEEAWVLLAQTFADLERRMECIQRAREFNPYSAIIAEAIQNLKAEILQTAFSETKPPPLAANSKTNPLDAELARAMLDAADVLAQATVQTTEPKATCEYGLELVQLLERAAARDAFTTHRWVAASGRAALVKYERALTVFIVNLAQDDAQLAPLRAQRQRALDLFK